MLLLRLLPFMFILAGCVISDQSLLGEDLTARTLPDQVVIVSQSNTPTAYAWDGKRYRYKWGDDGYTSLQFARLNVEPGVLHVVEARLSEGNFGYALVELSGESAKVFHFDSPALARSAGVRAARGSKETIQLNSRRDLSMFYTAAAKQRATAGFSTYRILNMALPANTAPIAQLKQDWERKVAAKKAAKAAKPQTPPPAAKRGPVSSGQWQLSETVDPMTDRARPTLVGQPAQADGVRQKPQLRFSCGKDRQLWPTIHWGVPIRNAYPDGQVAIARVTVRFGTGQPADYGWPLSTDQTRTSAMNPAAGSMLQIGQTMLERFGAAPLSLTWTPAEFRRKLAGTNRLILRARNIAGDDATLIFDTTGFAKLAAEMDRRC